VRWSRLKLLRIASGKGSRRNVTESKAIARIAFPSVSSVGAAVLLGVIAKFGSEMLKERLSTASILIRAVEVGELGMMMVAAPVLGLLEERITGKVFPQSMEGRMRTFAQLIGAAEVLATFHVTV